MIGYGKVIFILKFCVIFLVQNLIGNYYYTYKMKDITYYFTDLPDNNKNASIALNVVKPEHTKIQETSILLNENLRIKRKRNKHIFVLNKREELIQNESIKLIKSDSKGQLKRKMIEEFTKIENRLEKRKKISIAKSNINFKAIENNEHFSSKKHDFNHLKHSGSLFKYFSKIIPEETEKEKHMKAKVTIKADVHNSQISSYSICTIFDNKNKELSKTTNVANSEYTHDDIDLIESEKSFIQPNKQKWSLKIQLQSSNIHVSDIMNIYTPLETLQLENKNIKISEKIPKILLPIKNRKKYCSILDDDKSKKKQIQNLKVNNIHKCKTDIAKTEVDEKLNYIVNHHRIDVLNSEKKKLHIVSPITKNNCIEQKSKMTVASQNLNLQLNIHKNDIINTIHKIIPSEYLILPFPKVSHITQLPIDNISDKKKYNICLKTNKDFKQSFELLQIKSVLKLDNEILLPECVYKCVKADIQTVIFEIESYYFDAQALWKSISKLTKHTKIKYTSNNKMCKQLSQHNSKNELCNSLWINKYKPTNSMEIVGNEEGVAKLKSWLKYWKLLKNNKEYSSSEEFYSSDCCVSNYVENNKVAVLIGPHGSGKTASVYAIANELGYKVLEINASSKRLGKQILKDFEEATKSHRVEKLHFNNIFTSLSKTKKNNNISQNSLILMEDVDLVFDEDQGFVTAMFQLVSSTKRPIVMTLTNNCFNLCKMAPQYLQINFTSVTGKKVVALLQLITLAETGCKLSINCLNALCQNGDLRKELLQLQYMLISDKEQIPFTSLAINNSFLKNIQIFIYKSAIKASKNIKMNHIFNDKSLTTVVLDKLVNYLDIFILISVLVNIDDPTSYLFELKSESSLSLIEHSEYYSSLDNISVEIGYWFNDTINKLISNDFKKTNSQIDINKYQLSVKKQINSRKSILSKIVSNTTNQQALAIDYLSNIRTICRAEEIRNQLNHKRGNRFYHYLQSSKLKIEKSSNILSSVCKILQSRPNEL